MLQGLQNLDKTILLWVHNYLSNTALDWLMPLITEQDNWILPALVLIFYLGFKAEKRGKITLVLLILTIILTDSICAQILKPFIERVRPSHLNMEGLNLLVSKGGKWSMPSNHAANIFAFAVILSYFYEKAKFPVFSLAFMVAFSRIYVGVHYLGDVIVGSILGYGIAWTILTLWVILKMRELKRGKTWVWYESSPPVFKY